MDQKYISFTPINAEKPDNHQQKQDGLILNNVLCDQNSCASEDQMSLDDKQQAMVYYYVNKNGFTQQLETPRSTTALRKEVDQQSISSHSTTGSQTSLVKIVNGQPTINTISMINDSYVDLKPENIKYINFMIWMFFWCFPFTGIPALIYSHLMHKHYRLRDMHKAKKYLDKAERLILLTFVFGFTLVALLFAILQAYVFNAHVSPIVNITHVDRKHYPFIYH